MGTLESIALPSLLHCSIVPLINYRGGVSGLGYLPAGLRVSVVAEVLCDPVVDGGQRHFGLLAGLHGHADERGVGVGRLDFGVRLVVHLCWGARLNRDVRVAGGGRRARGEARGRGGAGVAAGDDGAARVQGHPGGRGIPGRRAGRGVGAGSREAETFEKEVLLGGRTSGSGAAAAAAAGGGGSLRISAEDGEVLEPVEAGEAVVEGGRFKASHLVLREHREPVLFKPVGNIWTR